MSVSGRGCTGYLIGLLGPPALRAIAVGSELGVAAGLIVLVFFAVMLLTCREFNQLFGECLQSRFENDALIAELQGAVARIAKEEAERAIAPRAIFWPP